MQISTTSGPHGAGMGVLIALIAAAGHVAAQARAASENPYKLTPFEASFPAALEYPLMTGLEYGRSRR